MSKELENIPESLRPYRNRYVPKFLGEIQDGLQAHIGKAPGYHDGFDSFMGNDIHSLFARIEEGSGLSRDKLGEDRHAQLVSMARGVKALFLADPEDNNGKTMEGVRIIWAMDALIQEVRDERLRTGLLDDEGMLTGD